MLDAISATSLGFTRKLAILYLLFFSVFVCAQQPTMKLVYANYAPYSWTKNGEIVGLEIDILSEALHHRMGIPLEFQVLPWERAQKLVHDGSADAFVATINPQRLLYADASTEPITYWQVMLYVRNGDQRFENIKSIADLAPFHMGSLVGNGWATSHLLGMKVTYVREMDLLPKMLVANRFDVIPDSVYVMRPLLQAGKYNALITEVPRPLVREGMYFFLGKKSPFYPRLSEFNKVLGQMIRDGTLKKIHEKYATD